MPAKIKVRKFDRDWCVGLPIVGFGTQMWHAFPSHAEALAFAAAEVARRTAPQSIYSSVSGEGWGPWTLKAPRR